MGTLCGAQVRLQGFQWHPDALSVVDQERTCEHGSHNPSPPAPRFINLLWRSACYAKLEEGLRAVAMTVCQAILFVDRAGRMRLLALSVRAPESFGTPSLADALRGIEVRRVPHARMPFLASGVCLQGSCGVFSPKCGLLLFVQRLYGCSPGSRDGDLLCCPGIGWEHLLHSVWIPESLER